MCSFSLFFFNDTATTEIYTLSLHDALPISLQPVADVADAASALPGQCLPQEGGQLWYDKERAAECHSANSPPGGDQAPAASRRRNGERLKRAHDDRHPRDAEQEPQPHDAIAHPGNCRALPRTQPCGGGGGDDQEGKGETLAREVRRASPLPHGVPEHRPIVGGKPVR